MLQPQNCGAAEVAVRAGRFETSPFLFDEGRRRVHLPGGQRYLETLHCGDRLCDAVTRASVIPVGEGDPGVDLPGKPLPGALLGGERPVEKPLSLQPRANEIALREPQLSQACRKRHAPITVETHRI